MSADCHLCSPDQTILLSLMPRQPTRCTRNNLRQCAGASRDQNLPSHSIHCCRLVPHCTVSAGKGAGAHCGSMSRKPTTLPGRATCMARSKFSRIAPAGHSWNMNWKMTMSAEASGRSHCSNTACLYCTRASPVSALRALQRSSQSLSNSTLSSRHRVLCEVMAELPAILFPPCRTRSQIMQMPPGSTRPCTPTTP